MPVNYYTEEAITALGELIGEVKVVAFDPEKSQSREYVRVLVRFNVTRPLRKSKVVNLPEGGSTVVYFNYERIQKRCYECQRLNHSKDVCPLLIRKRKEMTLERRQRIIMDKAAPKKVIDEDDPLFGILNEEQVGLCKETGRRKISPEVLEEMRRYMMAATEADKAIRADRVKISVAEAEKDPVAQKTILRLESKPIFTKDLDLGKGLVYDFDLNEEVEHRGDSSTGEKLMASAIKAHSLEERQVHRSKWLESEGILETKGLGPSASMYNPGPSNVRKIEERDDVSLTFEGSSTGYGLNPSVIQPSGASSKKVTPRRRPYMRMRQDKKLSSTSILQELYGSAVDNEKVGSKRRQVEEEIAGQKVARRDESRVIPHEGSPQSK
ncbi:uncharacterized protein LOC125596620 [Brassica napus]|uniref:uncharacterized protein LOC125596620 n=1 Tax=Brassica napus TaxID=3708 RepID=UPI0020790656|nr:uncharacterized protein LOC125596620 [Brassica napus]